MDPRSSHPIPFDYGLYLAARRQNVPVWVLEGYPIDQPPLLWIVRILEYARLEASATGTREYGAGMEPRPARWLSFH